MDNYITFKDVTGAITQRPGDLFYKHNGISDEQIDEYKDRGAELIHIDPISHAAAVKNLADTAHIAAKQKLASVPPEPTGEDEYESADITRRRDICRRRVKDAEAAAKEAMKRYDAAVKHEKTKAAKPVKDGK